MDKELIDRVWKYCLPKEFKEEVKELYCTPGLRAEVYTLLQNLFGAGNLTSDAEGEEMLTVPRKKVEKKWQRAYEQEAKYSRAQDSPVAREELYYNRGIMSILDTLFGSKCLPDNVATPTPNVESSHDNVDSSRGNVDGLKPKYHKGDKVLYKGKLKVVMSEMFPNRYYSIALPNGQSSICKHESDLEPYTAPERDMPPNVNNSDIDIDELVAKGYVLDPAKQFDNIIKDNFRDHNRLQIAAMAMQGLLSNTTRFSSYEISDLVRISLNCAEALIAESEKGGNNGK